MKNLINSCFDFAKATITVANTPLFLANELRSSADIRKAALSIDKNSLRRRLINSLKAEPANTRQEVAPYIYIVMASLQGNVGLLSEAKSFECINHNWFFRITDYLHKTSTASSTQTIDLSKHSNSAKKTVETDPIVNIYNSIDVSAAR